MRKTKILPGSYYHLYNRGVNREYIFFGGDNYQFFLRRINRYFLPSFVDLIAYCFMPNHYHLLVRVKVEDFGRKVMQPLFVSYTKAINEQQGRVGHLFQGPFQAKLVKSDSQLLHLSRYIHLNPVAAGLVKKPEEWSYSSCREYLGLRKNPLIKPGIVLSQFRDSVEYAQFLRDDIEDGLLDEDVLIDRGEED